MKSSLLGIGILLFILCLFFFFRTSQVPSSPVPPLISFPSSPMTTVSPLPSLIRAHLETSKGTIKLELDGTAAPLTVGNFVQLANAGFYDGTVFHRVIPDFMIQGGDPLSKDPSQKARVGTGGPGYTFSDEINSNKLVRGALAMANSGPNTNGSQFFIITADSTPWLDGKHTFFGHVVSGMDVVDAISHTERDGNDRPREDVVITHIRITP